MQIEIVNNQVEPPRQRKVHPLLSLFFARFFPPVLFRSCSIIILIRLAQCVHSVKHCSLRSHSLCTLSRCVLPLFPHSCASLRRATTQQLHHCPDMSVPSRKSVKRSRNEISSAPPLKKLPRASTSHARSKSALSALSAARSHADTTPAAAAEEAQCGELAPLSNSSEERSDAVRSACGRPMRSCRKQQVNYNHDELHPHIDDEEKEDNAEEKGELKQRVRMTGQSSEEDDYNDEEESDYCDERESSDEDCVEQLAPVASSPCASSLSSAASVASVVASSYTLPTAYTHYTVTATVVGGHKRGFTYFDVNMQILPRDAIRLPVHTARVVNHPAYEPAIGILDSNIFVTGWPAAASRAYFIITPNGLVDCRLCLETSNLHTQIQNKAGSMAKHLRGAAHGIGTATPQGQKGSYTKKKKKETNRLHRQKGRVNVRECRRPLRLLQSRSDGLCPIRGVWPAVEIQHMRPELKKDTFGELERCTRVLAEVNATQTHTVAHTS